MKMEGSVLLAILSVVQLVNGQVFSDYTGGSELEITEAMLVGRNKTNITEVDLSSSGIIDILDDAFALLPKVERIILSGNNFGSDSTRIGEYAFRGLPRLWYMDLSGNSAIVSLTANSWTDLLKANLTHLLVGQVQMEDADFFSSILSEYSSLLYLDATGIYNSYVNSYYIAHSLQSPPLQVLILDNCKLEMTDDSLSRLKSLSRLSLSGVDMQPSTDQFMTTLIQHLTTTIQRLDLNANSITSLDLSLRNLNQLTHLSLCENSFTALPLFSSVIYNNLVYLDISKFSTTLSSFTFPGTFTSLETFQFFSPDSILNDNNVTPLLSKVQSNLKHLNLNGNWQITMFPDLSRFDNLTRLELNNLALTEITQEDFQHLTMLEYLDISWNVLITIADMRPH